MVFTLSGHKLYSKAMDSVDATIPIETRRILLANRAQTFAFYSDIYEALRDLNYAISPQNSPKTLTAKCHYRRAKLLWTFARYDEAHADYHEFTTIMREMEKEVSGEDLKLMEDLDRRAAASPAKDTRISGIDTYSPRI
jgi:hypothetical protein